MKSIIIRYGLLCISMLSFSAVQAEELRPYPTESLGTDVLLGLCVFVFLLIALWVYQLSKSLQEEASHLELSDTRGMIGRLSSLSPGQIRRLLSARHKGAAMDADKRRLSRNKNFTATIVFVLLSLTAQAQDRNEAAALKSPGMSIMVVLIIIPLIGLVWFAGFKIRRILIQTRYRRISKEAGELNFRLRNDEKFYEELLHRDEALRYRLTDQELAGIQPPDDKKGLLANVAEVNGIRFIAPKRKAAKRHDIDPELTKLILWFICTAAFWLVTGTSIGEYIGIKFVAPDADHVSWLGFGRLRPVHTNMVFWGWSSLAMLGLGHYVVSTVSNAPLFSIRTGYYALILINTAVSAGSIALMTGINNGGGEYREYSWPIMGIFACGICLTLFNFLQTIARRKTKEVYISNWYIVSAIMFLLIIVIVGYVPWWQNGLGETIVQGYYMHQAVGMWFMLFNLGLIYYFLPQQLNTPIYSYSLGILAFWSQILFYTLIGTHHFLFSSIPWWLQTVAIVGSVGMLIPVFSGTTNFLMTIKGNYHKVARSYTLPFYLTGILFYFTGSTQGTAEAFRSANLVWHFTDFTVAHSHITMYGIIAFMLWACIYTLVPRLTGKEARQGMVGAHFWMALVGIFFYSIPLMIGGTLKGMGWVAGKPFIDGVVLMAPYWLWRAIGGSLMWASHIVFAWNMYAMIAIRTEADIRRDVYEKLQKIPVNPII